jgi:hypothetical protein
MISTEFCRTARALPRCITRESHGGWKRFCGSHCWEDPVRWVAGKSTRTALTLLGEHLSGLRRARVPFAQKMFLQGSEIGETVHVWELSERLEWHTNPARYTFSLLLPSSRRGDHFNA